ncbi:sigma-54-dependent Fis family transcriptional regulator [Methylobacter sp. S3L5C]|uniref:sigma-54 interaction domain-containing protein n=1 Tax=Methylobacter sp. S3L5C TaxID=2839024 RepID=UPI001FAE4509|nr:sigma-54 dependent transcriptional regulator [Methylobacter sp. S3L5C]UOA07313.1 sigma-54 dependent transcriptional regulator [Methylobacter sp. S3L5C]
MSVATRNLIVFQPSIFGNQISNQLLLHNWVVYIANDLEQATQLLYKHKFKVGLYLNDMMCGDNCLIDNCTNGKLLAKLHLLFNSDVPINWITGLHKECRSQISPDFNSSKLIAKYCDDDTSLSVDIKDLLIALGHAYGTNKFDLPVEKQITHYPSRFGIIGNSSLMVDLFNRLQKVSKEDCSVLIEGETGTGKELVANAIHNNSNRSKYPLVAINCGAFPKDLIQAELFGYEKGAFTGAQQSKIGRIESAQGGTLFLDEIGDLPFEQQINLLRFLEDRTIERIGGSAKIAIDVRVIAATHVDLKAAVLNGTFREDLYYRLQVLQIKTPSLRMRENDIELLAYYYFNKFSAGRNYKSRGFSLDALFLLKNYEWPGNVRQLMNVIRHAIVLSENRLLTPMDLGLEKRHKNRTLQTLEQARAITDRELIFTTLRHTNNNISRSAQLLGISRVSLYRLMHKYTIENLDF